MAVIQSGATTDLATVEPATKAMRVALYRQDGRFYTVRATSGILAATLAADSPVFGIREAAAPTKNIYIMKMDIGFNCTVAFTTGSQVGFYLERFSVANLAGGTAYVPMKFDTSDSATEAQDIRASTTATLTSAGVTFDGNKVPILGFGSPLLSQQIGPFTCFDSTETAPIRLQAGEGLALRNQIVWPAAGTGVLYFRVTWVER